MKVTGFWCKLPIFVVNYRFCCKLPVFAANYRFLQDVTDFYCRLPVFAAFNRFLLHLTDFCYNFLISTVLSILSILSYYPNSPPYYPYFPNYPNYPPYYPILMVTIWASCQQWSPMIGPGNKNLNIEWSLSVKFLNSDHAINRLRNSKITGFCCELPVFFCKLSILL